MSLQHIKPGPEDIRSLRSEVVYEFIGVNVDAPPPRLGRYDGEADVHWSVQSTASYVRRRPSVYEDTTVYHEETLEYHVE